MLTQAHLYISGDVIGVGFRAWAKIQAKLNQVTGWVRNVIERPEYFGPGGGVEAVVQGEKNQTEAMIKLLKAGPPVARVENVEIIWQEVKEIFEDFSIRK